MSKKIACIDIGSHRVKVLLAQRNDDATFTLLGVGSQATENGVEAGVITDIELTSVAVANAMNSAQREVGRKYNYECVVCISGDHLRCVMTNSLHTVVKSGLVTEKDINTLIDLALAEPVERDQEVLEVIPRHFILDGSEGVVKPLNMSCQHLGLEAIMVLAHPNKKLNLLNTVTNNNLTVMETVASGLVASQAVLQNDELDAGCCVIDIGAGTTDVCVFKKGVLESMVVLPVGGNQVTDDISRIFRITQDDAEELKIEFGHVEEKLIEEIENIDININAIGHDTAKQISRRSLALAIGSCYRDILEQIKMGVHNSVDRPDEIFTYILTGGGSSIEGMRFLAEEIFDSAVRIGNPTFPGEQSLQIETGSYASCVGLLMRQMSPIKTASVFGISRSIQKEQKQTNRLWAWLKANL